MGFSAIPLAKRSRSIPMQVGSAVVAAMHVVCWVGRAPGAPLKRVDEHDEKEQPTQENEARM
jgi:hypothetical protein